MAGTPRAGGPGPHARSSRSRGFALGLAIGVVGTLLLGGILTVTTVIRFGSDAPAAADTRPIALPESLSGYREVTVVQKERNPASSDRIVGLTQRMTALTIGRYKQAYGGASVAVRRYASADLKSLPTVIAVRAHSPGLVNGPIVDPEDLGLSASPGVPEFRQFGNVECMTTATSPVPAGKTIESDDVRVLACRRTSPQLTVDLFPGSQTDPKQLAALVDAAFDAVRNGS